MPVKVTAKSVLKFAEGHMPELPSGSIISNLDTELARASIEGIFEIKKIWAIEVGHRLELEWGAIGENPLWLTQSMLFTRLRRADYQLANRILRAFEERYEAPVRWRHRSVLTGEALLCNGQIPVDGLAGFSSIRALGATYFLPGFRFLA